MNHAHRSLLALTLALSSLAVTSAGCVRRYSQPAMEDPHADVQIRVVHHAELGPNVEEIVTINGEAVRLEGAGSVREAVMRIRPEGMQYGFETEFYHFVQQQQTVWENQRYQCGSNRQGPVYCNRQVPVQRVVTTRVSDGGCGTLLDQVPLAGAVYLVQYEFAGVGQCRATCQRIVQGVNGQSMATECGAGEPVPASPYPPSEGYVSAVSPTGSSGGEQPVMQPAN
jgi:hypothetical protein